MIIIQSVDQEVKNLVTTDLLLKSSERYLKGEQAFNETDQVPNPATPFTAR